ncbi:SEC-C metal-binding domain-containing protein [uncultured Ilyobacter sp.]|uniref:YecA family protein n=1 Tax=uncultured Ilyobacter sp. TaxID=544433 RepID=UPI0029F52014|nr:SEC-C metal-binding domain-containing protein [uncultured Ilyobacter sp.]
MEKDNIIDYIRAAVKLYGIISPEKLAEIYNLYNEAEISVEDFDEFKETEGEIFEYFKGAFVHEVIAMYDEYEDLIMKKMGKAYYIPEKEIFLQYADDDYMEKNEEYRKLKSYIKTFVKDEEMAEGLCEDIQLSCEDNFSMESVAFEFERRDIEFESESQVKRLIPLVIDLANSTRIWENNGYTPNEMSSMEKEMRKPLKKGENKVGRNSPCPCGSGLKYKKCCGK